MASKRCVQLLRLRVPAASPIIRQPCSRALSTCARTTRVCSRPSTHANNLGIISQTSSIQKRWNSQPPASDPPQNKIYSFDDILSIATSPSPTTLLIDVREPHEFAANSIPHAINIPVSSQPDALLLSDEEFEDRFGFEKPGLEEEVVFFCKAGVRSKAGAGIARVAG
ncbi:hypothetical protein IQ07DRAFT_646410 [Pyrenochaeta sp. DS3sAY3a]|nr:hypothetical protein IQ07DRAFT_646410 [Pyrenochaeta sp. DS3sAY3a]